MPDLTVLQGFAKFVTDYGLSLLISLLVIIFGVKYINNQMKKSEKVFDIQIETMSKIGERQDKLEDDVIIIKEDVREMKTGQEKLEGALTELASAFRETAAVNQEIQRTNREVIGNNTEALNRSAEVLKILTEKNEMQNQRTVEKIEELKDEIKK